MFSSTASDDVGVWRGAGLKATTIDVGRREEQQAEAPCRFWYRIVASAAQSVLGGWVAGWLGGWRWVAGWVAGAGNYYRSAKRD